MYIKEYTLNDATYATIKKILPKDSLLTHNWQGTTTYFLEGHKGVVIVSHEKKEMLTIEADQELTNKLEGILKE